MEFPSHLKIEKMAPIMQPNIIQNSGNRESNARRQRGEIAVSLNSRQLVQKSVQKGEENNWVAPNSRAAASYAPDC